MDVEDEFKAIANMLERAEKESLTVEVVWAFANELRNGVKHLGGAAAAALYEWDI